VIQQHDPAAIVRDDEDVVRRPYADRGGAAEIDLRVFATVFVVVGVRAGMLSRSGSRGVY
jgi:hypothetical protein